MGFELEVAGWGIAFFPGEVLAPLMFLALIAALLSGYPVAFGLGGVAVIFGLLGIASGVIDPRFFSCLLYTSPSPRDRQKSRMPSSA